MSANLTSGHKASTTCALCVLINTKANPMLQMGTTDYMRKNMQSVKADHIIASSLLPKITHLMITI